MIDRVRYVAADKCCTKCGHTGPAATDFYPDKRRRSGVQPWCRTCKKASVMANPNRRENSRLGTRRYRERQKVAAGGAHLVAKKVPDE